MENDDGTITVKIADFGFAKQLVDLMTTVTRAGSPAFMAPEILARNYPRLRPGTGVGAHGGYDATADLWSSGCVLYNMLCKDYVYDTQTVHTVDALVDDHLRQIQDGGQVPMPGPFVFDDMFSAGSDRFRQVSGSCPTTDYNQGTVESAASRRCRELLAGEAGVAAACVSIIGGRQRGDAVIVSYRRDVVLTQSCADLLGRLLRYHPGRRISWDDFFAHQWLQPEPDREPELELEPEPEPEPE